jgi:hypothetical protein
LKLNFCNYNMYFKLSEGHLPLNSFCVNTHTSGKSWTSLRKAIQIQKRNLYYRKMSKQFIFSYLSRTHGQQIKDLTQVFQGCQTRYSVRFNKVYIYFNCFVDGASTFFFISCKIMDFSTVLDNYTLHMIAEKQSISNNYNSFFCFAFHVFIS